MDDLSGRSPVARASPVDTVRASRVYDDGSGGRPVVAAARPQRAAPAVVWGVDGWDDADPRDAY